MMDMMHFCVSAEMHHVMQQALQFTLQLFVDTSNNNQVYSAVLLLPEGSCATRFVTLRMCMRRQQSALWVKELRGGAMGRDEGFTAM